MSKSNKVSLPLLLLSVSFLITSCVSPMLSTPDAEQWELDEEKQAQRIEYVKMLINEQIRLAKISHRIAIKALPLCNEKEALMTGALLFDWDLTTDEWLDVANDAIGINMHIPGIEVLYVIPGSAAEKAGLEVGDRIISVNEWKLPSSKGAFKKFTKKLRQYHQEKTTHINLMIQREADFLTVKLTPSIGCNFPVVLLESEDINAFTDGETIMLNRGLVRFARNDKEIAMVITHEMAHILAGHIDAKRKNAASGASIGLVFDILAAAANINTHGNFSRLGAQIGSMAYSIEFEREADYIGAYILAQAGYDIADMQSFWRYLGSIDPESMEYGTTHPSSTERAVNIKKIVNEIKQKKAMGQPLIPHLSSYRSQKNN